MDCTTQRDETNTDETIVPAQNLLAFSEYSNPVLNVLDEQTEGQTQARERKKWPTIVVTTSITLPTAVEVTSPKTTELVHTHAHPSQQEELRAMVNQSLRRNTFGQQLPTSPIIPIFTNTIQGDQVVNVTATTASTMHMTSVTTTGEIFPDLSTRLVK